MDAFPDPQIQHLNHGIKQFGKTSSLLVAIKVDTSPMWAEANLLLKIVSPLAMRSGATFRKSRGLLSYLISPPRLVCGPRGGEGVNDVSQLKRHCAEER